MIELTFLKELIVVRQTNQESDIKLFSFACLTSINSFTCHYWFFLNKGFKFQPNICNRGHDLLNMSRSLNNFAILNMKSANYCWVFGSISKREAINLMQNIDLTEISISLIKMGKEILNVTFIRLLFFQRYRYWESISI